MPDVTLAVGAAGVTAIDGSLVLIWLLMVAMRIAVRSGVVGDCEDNAKPRGAPYSKHAGFEDIPYSYSHMTHFLTAFVGLMYVSDWRQKGSKLRGGGKSVTRPCDGRPVRVTFGAALGDYVRDGGDSWRDP